MKIKSISEIENTFIRRSLTIIFGSITMIFLYIFSYIINCLTNTFIVTNEDVEPLIKSIKGSWKGKL
jgi:hypothetical protein